VLKHVDTCEHGNRHGTASEFLFDAVSVGGKPFCLLTGEGRVKPEDLARLSKITGREINPAEFTSEIYLLRVGYESMRHEIAQIRATSFFALAEEGDSIIPLNEGEEHLEYCNGYKVLGTIFMSESDYEYLLPEGKI